MLSALAVENSGRPLVRVGAEGAAKSIGLTINGSSCDPSEAHPAARIGPTVVVRLKCSKSACSNRSKEGCPYQYCQQCCCVYIASLQESIDSSPLLSTTSTTTSGVSVVKRCPVHKFGIKPLPLQARKSSKSQCATVSADVLPQEATSSIKDPLTSRLNTSLPTTDSDALPSSNRVPYTCCCKAQLIGIGADEQMGGYRYIYSYYASTYVAYVHFASFVCLCICSRHRSVYKAGGWAALERELDADMARIWRRNLGRWALRYICIHIRMSI